jgi:hypothetical protein
METLYRIFVSSNKMDDSSRIVHVPATSRTGLWQFTLFLKWNWRHYSSGSLLPSSGPKRPRFDRRLGSVIFVVDTVVLRVGISPSTSFLQPTRIPRTAPYQTAFFNEPSGRCGCRPHTDGIVKQCNTPELWPPLWSSGQSSWLQNANGDVLCFLWGTNWIYICYVEESWPPLWSSGQSSWVQNEDELSFLWGTNWIYKCYVEDSRPPLWSSGQRSWLQNGDVLCFLWGTNRIYICSVEESSPPLWSSGYSSWLQNGDVLCFLWGTNWIYICYVEESRPPL